jgi:hypothetical protein
MLCKAICLSATIFAVSFPSTAQTLDLKHARQIMTLDEYNVTSNFVANNGNIVIGDTPNDKIIVQPIDGSSAREIVATPQPLFITNIDSQRVAVSDAMNNLVSVYNIESGRKVSQYNYFEPIRRFPQHFGPWQILHHEGIIYGSDRFDAVDNGGKLHSMITTFDLRTSLPTKTWPLNWSRRSSSPTELNYFSGPEHLAVSEDVLYVIERGHPGNPTDDRLSIFNMKTWERTGRIDIPAAGKMGNAYTMLTVQTDICILFGAPGLEESYLRCGLPHLSSWDKRDLELGATAVDLAKSGDLLFVLFKGDIDIEGDESVAIVKYQQNAAPQLVGTYKLSSLGALQNIRQIAFDDKTSTLLVRSAKAVHGIKFTP